MYLMHKWIYAYVNTGRDCARSNPLAQQTATACRTVGCRGRVVWFAHDAYRAVRRPLACLQRGPSLPNSHGSPLRTLHRLPNRLHPAMRVSSSALPCQQFHPGENGLLPRDARLPPPPPDGCAGIYCAWQCVPVNFLLSLVNVIFVWVYVYTCMFVIPMHFLFVVRLL